MFSLADQIAVQGRSGGGRDAEGSSGVTAGKKTPKKKKNKQKGHAYPKGKKCKIKHRLTQMKFYNCY